MKYACENCYTCCITVSSQITYCALPTQCTQNLLSYHQALSFTLLITFLLAGALVCLYLAFRNRQLLENNENNHPAIHPPEKNYQQAKPDTASLRPKFSMRSNSNGIKINEQLQIQSKISHRFKHKQKKSAKITAKPSQQQTQRGLR